MSIYPANLILMKRDAYRKAEQYEAKAKVSIAPRIKMGGNGQASIVYDCTRNGLTETVPDLQARYGVA